MKVKLFTHTDMDGVTCAIVGKRAFSDIEIEYCDYNNVDAKVMDFLASGSARQYDFVFITDISVSEPTAYALDLEIRSSVRLLDHHKTAERLNKYPWASVCDTRIDGRKNCGASLFLDWIAFNDLIRRSDALDILVDWVRKYDTWEWQSLNDSQPKKLNDLFLIYGRRRFFDRFLKTPLPIFSDTERTLLELEKERIDRYINTKEKQIHVLQIDGYNVGVVFAESNQSELGNELAKRFSSLDLIAMIDPSRSVSYRTVKNDVDVSKFAEGYGGGGHRAASGSPIVSEFSEDIKRYVLSVR